MKKTTLLTGLFALLILIVSSCKKENEEIQPQTSAINEDVSVNNGRLVFKSVDEYEQLFEDGGEEKRSSLMKQANQSPSYTSMARYASDPSARSSYKKASTLAVTDSLYPEFLQAILNPEGIVQIGEYIIKVDMHNERVLVLKEEFKDQYSDLISDNLNNSNILIFSTSDEVLELLKEGHGSSPQAKISGLFCKDRRANTKSHENNPEENNYTGADGNSYAAKIEQRYQAAGIYFSLFSKIKNLYWNGFYWNYNTFGNTSLTFNNYHLKKRCGFEIYNSTGFTVKDGNDGNSKDGVVTYRLYESTTALKFYSLSTSFTYDDNSYPADGEKTHNAPTISDY